VLVTPPQLQTPEQPSYIPLVKNVMELDACARLVLNSPPLTSRGKRKAAVEGRQRFKEEQEDLEHRLKIFARENPKNAEPLYLEEMRRRAFGIPKNVTEYAVVRVRVTNRRGVVFTAQINEDTRAKTYQNRSGKRRPKDDSCQGGRSLVHVCAVSDSDSEEDSGEEGDGRLDLACHELLSAYD